MIKSSKRFVCYQRNLEFEFLRILLMLSNNFSTFFSKIQIQDSSTMFCSHQMFKRTKNIIIFIVTRLNIFVCFFQANSPVLFGRIICGFCGIFWRFDIDFKKVPTSRITNFQAHIWTIPYEIKYDKYLKKLNKAIVQ